MQTFCTLKQLTVIAALFFSTTLTAQDETIKPARNYAGLNGTIDAANASVTFGLEYERLLITKGRFAAGVRGNWYKTYTSSNADFSIGSSSYKSGYADDYRVSLLQVMGTARVFTSQQKEDRGFFISLAGGVIYNHAKKKQAASFGNATYVNWLPTIETGMGFVTSLGGNNTMKWSGAISFAGEQKTPRPAAQSGLIMLSLKAAVGF